MTFFGAHRRRCVVAATAVTLLLTAVLAPVRAGALPKPTPPPSAPVNPSNSALSSASAQKLAVANEVGQLGGEIAAAQAELQRLRGAQEMAEQNLAFAVSKLEDAKTAAAAARARVQAAAGAVVQARTRFVQYLQASYMAGDLDGTAGSLLTAQDPSALLDRSALEQYQADNQISAMGSLQRATVIKSNADAGARRAVLKEADATKAAKTAKAAADSAVADANARAAALQTTLAAKQQELQQKQLQLATLNGQRTNYLAWQGQEARYNAALSAYNTWKVEQARIAAAKAEAARVAKARAAELRQERAAEAAAAAAARAKAIRQHRSAAAAAAAAASAAAAARKHHRVSSGSSSGSSGGGSSYSSGSGGTAATSGAQAVRRALTTLGTRYIWAGGNKYGPTDGGCSDPIASCGTVGYDCSGLVLYAWGRNWDHLARNQYFEAGSYHPSAGHFRLGDLLFWSATGTRSGIHHVAIYIGNGDVIQAPQSGDVVRITPWDQVESDYYGATRPLT